MPRSLVKKAPVKKAPEPEPPSEPSPPEPEEAEPQGSVLPAYDKAIQRAAESVNLEASSEMGGKGKKGR